MWVTHILSTEVCTRVARGQDEEHDRSSVGEEGYATICAGYEGGERDGMRPFTPPCYSV